MRIGTRQHTLPQLLFALAALGLVFFCAKLVFGVRFKKFSDDQPLDGTWKTAVREGQGDTLGPEGRFVYSLVRSGAEPVEVARLGYDDLQYLYLERGDRKFVLTRYLGEGSSNAYYFSVIRLLPDSLKLLEASEVLDWGDDEPCLSSPRKREPASPPFTIFGDCSNPEILQDRLVFDLPGLHCGLLVSYAGCPSRTTVSLE